MQRLLFIFRCICTICIITALMLLAFQVIDIYHDASVSTPMYQMNDVIIRLKKLSIPLFFCLALMIISGLLHSFFSLGTDCNRRSGSDRITQSRLGVDERFVSLQSDVPSADRIRICLYVAAFLLIVFGVLNGGLRDVLVKAINICTECIGLG